MSSKNNSLAGVRDRRAAFWFALMPIAWLQLSLAVHQFDHVAEYVDESCHVCAQIDRVDDVTADSSIATPLRSAADRLTRPLSASTASRATNHGFEPRAPPQL